MDKTREFTIAVLKDLIQNCMEEQSLFNKASDKITDPNLIQTLRSYSKKKEGCINKLEMEIKRLGGDSNGIKKVFDGDSILKDIAADNDDDKILLECVNKDVMMLNRYSNAIKEEILWEVVPLVAKQYFESQNMHESLMRSFGNLRQVNYNIA